MLAYYHPPFSDEMQFIELNATKLQDAITIAKLVFGKKWSIHLYYKKVPLTD